MKKKLRFPILVLSFVLLIGGAILHYSTQKPVSWIIIGIAVILYIIARFVMREKKPGSTRT